MPVPSFRILCRRIRDKKKQHFRDLLRIQAVAAQGTSESLKEMDDGFLTDKELKAKQVESIQRALQMGGM